MQIVLWWKSEISPKNISSLKANSSFLRTISKKLTSIVCISIRSSNLFNWKIWKRLFRQESTIYQLQVPTHQETKWILILNSKPKITHLFISSENYPLGEKSTFSIDSVSYFKYLQQEVKYLLSSYLEISQIASWINLSHLSKNEID